MESFWTARERAVGAGAGREEPDEVDLEFELGLMRVEGGRRCRQREKSGEGKTVRVLTRMAVMDSGCVRCGLNWYLWVGWKVVLVSLG